MESGHISPFSSAAGWTGPRPGHTWSAWRIGYGKRRRGALPRPGAPGPPSVFPYATDRPRRRRPGSPPHHIAFGTGAGSAGLFCPAGRPVPSARRRPGRPLKQSWDPGAPGPLPLGRDIRPLRPVLRPGGFHSIRLFPPCQWKAVLDRASFCG